MAFVQVPKDLKGVKNKIAFGLTKRQIIFLVIGAGIGVPLFFTIRQYNQDAASFALVGTIMPLFIAGTFEKNELTFEKYMIKIIRQKFLRPKTRKYRMRNFYDRTPSKEVTIEPTNTKTAKKNACNKKSV